MKKVILIGSIILLVMSCTSEPTSAHKKRNSPEEKVALQHHIDSLEEVFSREGMQDNFTVSKLITAYSEYRNRFREDPLTEKYFLKAGNLALGSKKWEKAAEIFKNFFNDFPNNENREDVLFQLAGIYDLQLEDSEHAQQTYEHYLKLYPKGKHAESARACLAYVNMSVEERLEEFRRKNGVE